MGKSMLVEKFKDDYSLSAREKPHGPKAKLLVVELADGRMSAVTSRKFLLY
jgi:Mg-chelatase subunit ChlD